MKILIIGAGAIGVALGVTMAATGEEISFLASERTGNEIRKNGIHRTGLFGDADISADKVKVYSDYSELPTGEFDYVCISIKTTVNAETAAALWKRKDCLKAGGIIVILQNGWGNDLPYIKYFDKSVVYNARVITGFQRTAPNISNITVHTAPILIGSLHGYPKEKGEALSAAIRNGGIPSEVTDEVGKALWAKMLYNTTLNPLGAILKVPYGKLADCEASVNIMNRLIHETFSVMNAAGYTTFWNTPEEYIETFYGKLVPDTYAHRSSTYQDIEKKKKTEIETLTGTVIRLGEEYGIDTPTHRIIYEEILFLEAQF
ncbi:MAG: ketopantoate reductase family protein [Parasporobacterium sp.]|nr:ketopantoate reductase family protein [Parasporobacterium sp.]